MLASDAPPRATSLQILYNSVSEIFPPCRQVTRQEKNHLKWHFTYPLGSVPREDEQKPVFLLRSPVPCCNRMSHLLNQTTHDSNSNLSKWHGSMVKCLPNAVGMSLKSLEHDAVFFFFFFLRNLSLVPS